MDIFSCTLCIHVYCLTYIHMYVYIYTYVFTCILSKDMVGSCQTKSREPCLLDTKWCPCPRQAKKMVLMSLTRYEWIPKWWRPAPATNRNLFQWLQANDPTRQRHNLSLTPIGCSGHVADPGLQADTSRTGSISWVYIYIYIHLGLDMWN